MKKKNTKEARRGSSFQDLKGVHLPTRLSSRVRLTSRRNSLRKTKPRGSSVKSRLRLYSSVASPCGPKHSRKPRSLF